MMGCLYVLLCIIQVIKSKNSNKIISIKYEKFDNKLSTIIFLGYPSQDLKITLNQEKEYSYLTYPKYDVKQSLTYVYKGEEQVSFFGYSVRGTKISEMIELDGNFLMYSDLYFYHFQNNPIENVGYYGNSISLAYQFLHNNFSLIHSMKEGKDINKLNYAFIDKEKKIMLGGIPEKYVLDKYVARCKVNLNHNKFKKWGCNLNKAIVNNSKVIFDVPSNHYSYFSINEERIFVPEEFMNYLRDNAFASYISQEKCKYKNTLSYKYFYCDCRYIDDFPSIIFDFNGYQFELEKIDLFTEANDFRCNFNIATNIENQEDKTWSFGRVFILKYISQFDYDRNEILFYEDKQFGLYNTKKYYPHFYVELQIYFFITIMIIITIGIILICTRIRKLIREKINC